MEAWKLLSLLGDSLSSICGEILSSSLNDPMLLVREECALSLKLSRDFAGLSKVDSADPLFRKSSLNDGSEKFNFLFDCGVTPVLRNIDLSLERELGPSFKGVLVKFLPSLFGVTVTSDSGISTSSLCPRAVAAPSFTESAKVCASAAEESCEVVCERQWQQTSVLLLLSAWSTVVAHSLLLLLFSAWSTVVMASLLLLISALLCSSVCIC